MGAKALFFCLLPALLLGIALPVCADVPAPPPPPQTPLGYCSTIYNELYGYLQSFNQTLGNPAPYPTLQVAQLQMADANTGPAISGPNYLAAVMVQVQELQAMGFKSVKVEVAFPVLYEPFFGSTAAMQPYLNFYQGLAQNLKAMGMKLVVENNVLLATGTEAGWPTVGTYYGSLIWTDFIAGRAAMAATIAQYMQPDYLMLSEEPDTEALNTGQTNLHDPTQAAAMIAGEIAAARVVNSTVPLGAGFGTWMGPYAPSGLQDYLNAYVALPLDYIDMHIYPINTEYNGTANLLANALVIASGAAAASKPVAVSEAWPWKMEDGEFNKVSPDIFRARNPFSFWAPIDTLFSATMEKLANYSQMLYMSSQGNDYFLAYQTYGGTTANGGAATCTCTTASCSPSQIVAEQNSLSDSAGQTANFTATGFAYNSLLVTPPDTVPPAASTNLAASAGYSAASLTWNGSGDNVGVAGYNIYRCSPTPCTGGLVASTADNSFVDYGLTSNTPYTYTVEAFDMANNHSPVAATNVMTSGTTPPTSPTNLVATAISPKQINLTWRAPQNSSGLAKYIVYGGTSASSLAQIATLASNMTSFQNQPLTASTTYYYGIVAYSQGLNSPMSTVASATTLPLPSVPSQVTATPVSATKITITWQEVMVPGGLAIANYQVYGGTVQGALAKLGTALSTTYSATGLTPGTTYYFEVMAVDKSFDDSEPSDPVSATTLPMPPAPTGLAGRTPAATQIVLIWTWAPAPGGLPIARYLVYCGTSLTNMPQVGTATSPTYTYRSASPATTYFCDVVAVDSASENSAPSGVVMVTTPPMPNPPTGVTAVANSSTSVTVSWTEVIPQGGLGIQNYTILRGLTPINLNTTVTRSSSPYTDKTVAGGTTYYYAVEATDTGRDVSPMSSVVAVTTP